MVQSIMEPIILASGSSRRQEYFKMLGLPFSVMPARIDESLSVHKDPKKLTSELAVKKIENVLEEMRNRLPWWIFGADTVIAIENKIFGKAKDRENAAWMLKELSNRKHQVITSMALYNSREKKTDCRTVSCAVVFAPMTEAEINWYLNTNEWQGVAGAYRIQGLASCFINRIEGTLSAVAGLPLREFYVMLRDNGYPYGA
jgi:septum formation protein